MINPFSTIINYEGDSFDEFLQTIHLLKIFEPIINHYGDKETVKKVAKFIAYGYSPESDMLYTNGTTWANLSRAIFDYVELDEELFDEICIIPNEAIIKSAENWLQFQDNEYFTQYCHFRDLRRQFLFYSLDDLKKSSGEIDIDAKMHAAKYSNELLEMMERAKEMYVQQHPKLKGQVEALNRSNKHKDTRSVADYAIKK